MLKDNRPGHAAEQKSAERAIPSIPDSTDHGWQTHADGHRQEMDVAMLPHYPRVLLQIVHVIERRLRQKFEKEPADVRVEKTFADVVRIFVVIDVFMVPAMFARPHQHGILKGSRAEEQNKKPDRPFRAESKMGEKPVISERDAEP